MKELVPAIITGVTEIFRMIFNRKRWKKTANKEVYSEPYQPSI